MVNYWYITGDFLKERSGRIGASDIPALIPNPEKPTESLAGYGRTPVTVWQEKTGRKQREPAGIPAEMGHYLEEKSVELFIRTFAGSDIARRHTKDRRDYDYMTGPDSPMLGQAGNFQNTEFRHHVQYYKNGMICHPDGVYDPAGMLGIEPTTKMGIKVKFDEPFLIEAKSANFWAAKRPEGSIVKGYDFGLKTWQGIPLKHYMQIQFQLALMEVKTCYLTLIYNTSQFDVWEIRANKKHQGRLIDLAGTMVHKIKTDTPPAEMAMNVQDIMDLYPEIGDDFVILNGDERDKAIDIARTYNEAKRQESRWKEKADDAKDSMGVLLRDRPELRDGDGIIGKWRVTKGSEKITALSKIKADDLNAYRYLKKHELLYTSKESRTVAIPWKGDEI